MDKLPQSARIHFWDVNFDELDASKHKRFVIERLLEYGDIPELRWLFENFRQEKIVEVLKTTRRLSRRRASAWANFFEIPRSEVKCLSKSSQKRPATTWTY